MSRRRVDLACRWTPPTPGSFKINFDNGQLRGGGSGFGGIIRDDRGACIGWMAHRSAVRLSPEHGEYMAARLMMEFAVGMQLQHVTLEGDCLTLIRTLNHPSTMSDSSLGTILQDILNLTSYFLSFQAIHTPRCNNRVALAFAKIGYFSRFGYDNVYLPGNVIPLLYADILRTVSKK
ncbi:hypothetical protein M569_17406 [Genlisea aurea]|uniref:RNase H type-1 domain-containing protein n=1 Tax=Genlisea aurea TaxID=192259 RepID=S8D443_9LAMI|nr:hypothetical protein M569_17406 [Genlisea aurea]